ncbi:MAG: iron-containing alcohol dehydrogenase [Halieaceae bacterium]|nr:iron-containing alcohol dehydrogenase [Halieaceae bacterium]
MFQLTTTERVHLGERLSEALVHEVDQLGSSRIFLLVSSTLLKTTDEIERVCKALGDRVVCVHDGIPPHAPRSSVLEAAANARSSEADLIVTIGGGSVTDAGKIIPLVLKHGLVEHDDLEPFHVYVNEAGETIKPAFESPDLRVICCPTTLSGGEFNPLAGATDEKIGHKQGFEHPMMAPVAVILDPELTRHTPAWLWTSTGVRSVDHALETLGSLSSDHFSDGIAESALRLLSDALPIVHKSPDDMNSRLRCQIGAWQSMIPIIGGVPMGASHAIGHILGGTCDVPHGYCSCVMAPAVLEYNREVNADRQRRISDCFGRPGEDASKIVDEFISELGMPRSLSEVGVTEDRLDQIAEYTMLDFWARTNPKKIESSSDVRKILDLAI